MKKSIKYLIFSILVFLAVLGSVSASSITDVSSAYGYSYYDTNNTFHNYQWFGTYSSNNLIKYNYDLPSTYQNEGVRLVDYGIRFHISNNFQAGTNYTINFTWSNYNTLNDVFLANFSHLVWYSRCRVSSWTSTGYDETYCYNNYNLSYSRGLNDSDVIVTFSFNAKVDFYGFALYFYHDNDPYEYFYSDGWEITDISYSDTIDNSQAIINNQTQNTQNIINNQNQNTQDIIDSQSDNTQDIIDNQNQNAQDIQNTINDNFQSCRNSYNLFRSRANFTSGVVSLVDGVITLNGEVTSNTSVRVGYITVSPGSYIINPNRVGVNSGGSYFYFYVGDNIFSFSNTKLFNSSVSLTDESVWLVITRGTYDNLSFKIMLNEGDTSKPWEPYGQEFCTNKIDDTNNSINDVNDSINNPDVSDANSDASSFFSSFTETDHGGLSAIVTAPLVVVNSMLTNNSCSDLTFQVLGTNVSFPSGCILWNLADNNIITIWQTIICGFVSYILLKKLFKDIENLKNPGNSEVSTLDL